MNKSPERRIQIKESSNVWKEYKISELSSQTYGGGTPSTFNPNFWNGNIPWIQSSDIAEDQVLGVNPKKFISEMAISKTPVKVIPKNSLAIVTRVGVGKLAIMPFSYTTSQDFLSLSNLKSDLTFTAYAVHQKLQGEINSVQGTAIKGINKNDLLAKKINLPSPNDQKIFGRLFVSLDTLITNNKRKLKSLCNAKKYLLNTLFPPQDKLIPKIRFESFSTPWSSYKLSETVDIERGGSPRPIDKYLTKDPSGLNWVKIGDAPSIGSYITQTEEKIKKEGLSKTREVFPGDLILSNSMSFGKPYIMAIKGCIHDGWLLIRNNKNCFDLRFLCTLLASSLMVNQYQSLAAGSTVNNLNKNLVGGAKIAFPNKTEQKIIGKFFLSLNNLIELYQIKLDILRKVKKSLLKGIFQTEEEKYEEELR